MIIRSIQAFMCPCLAAINIAQTTKPVQSQQHHVFKDKASKEMI